jgi:cytochrome c oxidase cbb3-type subunit 3
MFHDQVNCEAMKMIAITVRLTMLALVLSASAMPASAAPDLELGQRLFGETCASCHGPAGRPDPGSPVVAALGIEPADLSDPLFNSREPALDWELVVKHGGRALGLSEKMPAWGASFTDTEIAALVAYIKTLAPGSDRYPPGELNLMLPIRTQKAFPEDEIVWKSRYENGDDGDVWRNVFEFEKRFGRRGQGILEVVEEEGELTEVEVGWKHAMTWSLERGYLLSSGAKIAVPTQSGGSEELIPFLAWAQELSPKATFQASTRAILPFDDIDDGALELAGIVHYTWTDRPQNVFPAFEATAAVPFDRAPGEDAVQFTVVPQIRIGVTRGGHVALNLGAEIPLSDQDYDWRAHLTLLWDFADGGFFKGWGR